MKPVLLLGLALAPLLAALDVCDNCRADKLCRPHAEHEQAEIERLRPALESEDADERIEALEELAALSLEHENAPGEDAAVLLAAALEDVSLHVREEALLLLTDGQHPEVTVAAVVDVLEGFKRHMWTLVETLMGPDQRGGTTADAMRYLETAMRVSGNVRDDRVVKALAAVLLAMPDEMRGEPVAMAATRSLLDLGTRNAVQAVLRQFRPWTDDHKMLPIQEALREFATDLGSEDVPEIGPDARDAWDRWLKKHSRDLPTKLGKWQGVPPEGEDEDD